jgi:hypothetical protein
MDAKKTPSIEISLADPTLNINIDDVNFSREMIGADSTSDPQQRGGYKSHQSRNEQNRDRMKDNLAFQLEWLRRHRPAIYDEVKQG